uniref:Uncharacterized protein n=1 Tax=Arundo donax TaxID=35708 RepID=A0A0A8Z816_ARUDO
MEFMRKRVVVGVSSVGLVS